MDRQMKLIVQDNEISMTVINKQDYISLTDMVSNIESGSAVIENWIRNKNTIELLGAWEQLYNPDFNSLEFEGIKTEAGSNRFHLSAKKWIESTNAIGIISKTGRYGSTLAHKDIAFNFGMWISPVFQLYIIKEYQRLKEVESNQYNLEWDVRRLMTKVNYVLHTDAVQKHIIPKSKFSKDKNWIEYANEADILNLALFGYTAKEWKDANPIYAKENKNMRDFASITDLLIMSNIESLSSQLINMGVPARERFGFLKRMADEQKEQFAKVDMIKSIKKVSPMTYVNAESMEHDEIEIESKKDILQANRNNLLEFKKGKDSKNKPE